MMSNYISCMLIIIFTICIYSVKDINNKIFISTLLVIYLFYYYIFLWSQTFNVYPSKMYKKKKVYRKKMLWINTNVINVNNPKHKQWANYIFTDSAPNKLGIYIDHPDPDKVFINRQIGIFKILFKHSPTRIYFTNSCNRQVSEFCQKKKINIHYFPFRFTTS